MLPYDVAAELAAWGRCPEIDGAVVRLLDRLSRRLVIADCAAGTVTLAGEWLDDVVVPLAPGWADVALEHVDGDGPDAHMRDLHRAPTG